METSIVSSHRQAMLQAAKDYEAAVKRSLGANVEGPTEGCRAPAGYGRRSGDVKGEEEEDVVMCQVALSSETGDQDS